MNQTYQTKPNEPKQTLQNKPTNQTQINKTYQTNPNHVSQSNWKEELIKAQQALTCPELGTAQPQLFSYILIVFFYSRKKKISLGRAVPSSG